MQVIEEQGLDPFDALEAVRLDTAEATPDQARNPPTAAIM